MSHQVAKKADGSGAMFAVGDTPWHQAETNSTVFPKGQGPKTAKAAAKGAGLDWEAELRPAFVEVGNGDYLEVEGAKVVMRSDRAQALGVVGSFYRPLQNLDMLATLQPLVDQGLATWETAGVLQEGRRVWAMTRLNLDSKIIREAYGQKGDRIIPFQIIMNSHDGSGKVVMAETRVRVVCRNTELAAEHDVAHRASTQRVRHNQSVEVNVAKAAEALWSDIISRHEALALQMIQLRRTRLDDKLFRELVLDVALPLPEQAKESELAAKLMNSRTEKVEAKREIVVKLWTDGLGQSGDRSAWEALNAVTEATDHDRGVWSPKGNRLVQLMPGGALQEIKADVRGSLVAYANRENAAVALTA